MPGKLFELLAVEGDQQGRFNKLVDDTVKVFAGKPGTFLCKKRTLALFDRSPERIVEVEALEKKELVQENMAGTVPASLNYLGAITAQYFDVLLQKEIGNQEAKADLVVDGVTIAKDVPVGMLMGFESRLNRLRDVFIAAPTADNTTNWTPDGNAGAYVMRSPEVVSIKTSKEIDTVIVVPATDKFPAQVDKREVMKNIGKYTDTIWTGMLTSADKAALLSRLDKLIGQVKRARMRANDIPSSNATIGDNMMRYLLGAWYDPENTNAKARV